MPYSLEPSSTISHSDFIKQDSIKAFLENCLHIAEPAEVCKEAAGLITSVNPERSRRKYIVCADGSFYTSQADSVFPSRQVGYIKIGATLTNLTILNTLRDKETGLVDPALVNKLQEDNQAWTICLPHANIRYKEFENMRDTFRFCLNEFFEKENLNGTLQFLSSFRPRVGNASGKTYIEQCPSCHATNIFIDEKNLDCPHCGKRLYISDCLRLWETIEDFIPSTEAQSKLMIYLEHILPVHWLRGISPIHYGDFVFCIDNPLGIFGQGAWLHASLMRVYTKFAENAKSAGSEPPLIIGTQKTGALIDVAKAINATMPKGSILIPSDEFRYKFTGGSPSSSFFGKETYYGQDILYFTKAGKVHVFSLLYPCLAKKDPQFENRFNPKMYQQLNETLGLIDDLSSQLYENALIPIILAHKYTSISINPSGNLLDTLTKTNMKKG